MGASRGASGRAADIWDPDGHMMSPHNVTTINRTETHESAKRVALPSDDCDEDGSKVSSAFHLRRPAGATPMSAQLRALAESLSLGWLLRESRTQRGTNFFATAAQGRL